MNRVTSSAVIFLWLAGCTAFPPETYNPQVDLPPTETATPFVPQAVEPPTATATRYMEPSPTESPTLGPGEWKTLPVLPLPGPAVALIYQTGVELGNNPRAFSKVGDCESTPAWFLGAFDQGPDNYRLGGYADLAEVIAEFQGSYSRKSLAVRNGFTASSVLSPLWADGEQCGPQESPLECEYRIHKPMYAFIMLGTNDYGRPSAFEPNLRRILELSRDYGVIPILSTKADNLEGDESINATIARLAQEFGVPLWNFWAAVQPLPDHGLQEDGAHLTVGQPFFDDPFLLQKAWPVRNLTALQTLDAVWRAAAGR